MRRVAFTIDELRENRGVFSCGYRYTFHCHAFAYDETKSPPTGEMIGCLFTWDTRRDAEGIERVTNRVVSGGPCNMPLRVPAVWRTFPAGDPLSWTAGELAACDFEFTMPDIVPEPDKPQTIPGATYRKLAQLAPCRPADAPATS